MVDAVPDQRHRNGNWRRPDFRCQQQIGKPKERVSQELTAVG